MRRRNFIKDISAAGLALGTLPILSCANPKPGLRILVLGGTEFLGPAIVKAGLQVGHQITLFNRGITNPQLFSELPLIKGDRELGSSVFMPLKGQHWDVVIDVWPQESRLVDDATKALQPLTDHYVFVSSVSVYKDFNIEGITEDYPMVPLPKEKETWGYSEEKAASEVIVTDRFPNNHTILRPGPIKGYRDPAYDLLYWLIKLQRSEPVLAPSNGEDPLQFIDVRDVGQFAIKAVENQLVGTFNCVGPKRDPLSWKEFLERAKKQLDSSSELCWSSENFLRENKVWAWDDLPLWAPISDDAFMQISNKKSLAAGFQYSALEDTIDQCVAWNKEKGNSNMVFGIGEEPIGLEKSRELEVIGQLRKGDNHTGNTKNRTVHTNQ